MGVEVPATDKAPPFLGASAPWVDDEEATYEHAKRQVADHLRDRLKARITALSQTDLSTEEVATELRRQMAECAVDGNLMLASDLGEATWDLLQYRKSADSL
jgi:hypothetical protein